MQDKRKNRRFTVRFPCRLRVRGQEESVVNVTMVNVSLGGIGVVADRELAVDSRVVIDCGDILFAAADGAGLTCKVLNVNRSRLRPGEVRVGLEYEDVPPDLIHWLLQWGQTQALIEQRQRERMQKLRPGTKASFWG